MQDKEYLIEKKLYKNKKKNLRAILQFFKLASCSKSLNIHGDIIEIIFLKQWSTLFKLLKMSKDHKVIFFICANAGLFLRTYTYPICFSFSKSVKIFDGKGTNIINNYVEETYSEERDRIRNFIPNTSKQNHIH